MNAPGGVLLAPPTAPTVVARRSTATDDGGFSAALADAVDEAEATVEARPGGDATAQQVLDAITPPVPGGALSRVGLAIAPAEGGDEPSSPDGGSLIAVVDAVAPHPPVSVPAPLVVPSTAQASVEQSTPRDAGADGAAAHSSATSMPADALGAGVEPSGEDSSATEASLGRTAATPAPPQREETATGRRPEVDPAADRSQPEQATLVPTTRSGAPGTAPSHGSAARDADRAAAAIPNAPRVEGPIPVQASVPAPAPAPLPVAPPVAPTSPSVPVPLSTQIMPSIVAVASAGTGEHVVTITVSPENLGPVTIRAHITADGARFELSAPTELGRDALRSLLPELRRDAAGTGIDARLDLAGGGAERGRDDDDSRAHSGSPTATPAIDERGQPPATALASRSGGSSSTTIDITI